MVHRERGGSDGGAAMVYPGGRRGGADLSCAGAVYQIRQGILAKLCGDDHSRRHLFLFSGEPFRLPPADLQRRHRLFRLYGPENVRDSVRHAAHQPVRRRRRLDHPSRKTPVSDRPVRRSASPRHGGHHSRLPVSHPLSQPPVRRLFHQANRSDQPHHAGGADGRFQRPPARRL